MSARKEPKERSDVCISGEKEPQNPSEPEKSAPSSSPKKSPFATAANSALESRNCSVG